MIDFLNFVSLLKYNVWKGFCKRLFIESFLTKMSKYSINEAADIPSEYVIFT